MSDTPLDSSNMSEAAISTKEPVQQGTSKRDDLNVDPPSDQDTEMSSSFGDSEMPLFKYARLVGSLPRIPRRVSPDGDVIGSPRCLSDPCACSAMARVVLPPAAPPSTLDGMDGGGGASSGGGTLSSLTTKGSAIAQPPQYNILAMGFESGSLFLTDATTGAAVVPSEQLNVHTAGKKGSPLVDVSFDASGSYLAAVNQNGLVAIWEFRFTTVASSLVRQQSQQEDSVFGFLARSASNVVPPPTESSQSPASESLRPLAALTCLSAQASRIPYPASFGTPTCLELDPAYKKRREKAVLVGFSDGRLVMTKRGFMMFGRRSDSVIYQSPEKQSGGIQALAWRGSLVAWADDSGVKLFDVETMARIAHIDRPSGARLSLYPTVSSLRPSLLFETSESFLVAWGDCVMAMSIRERLATGTEEASNRSAAAAGGTAPGGDGTTMKAQRHVECTMAWELDCVACGVVPLDSDHLVVLGLGVPDSETSDRLQEDSYVKLETATSLENSGNELEVHVISRAHGTVVHCDALPLLERGGAGPTEAESASLYTILSSYALPRMDDAIEIEEEGFHAEDQDFDFEVSLFQSSSSERTKREFKDPHVKWGLKELSFDQEQSDEDDETTDSNTNNATETTEDSSSLASDDYGFLFRPLKTKPLEPTGSLELPPIMVVASRSDAVLVRTRDIDDAISHAIDDGKHALALKRALCYKRELRRYDMRDLIEGYLGALMRLPVDDNNNGSTRSAPDLSVQRLGLAAKALPVLLGGDIKLWEKWVSLFSEIPGALFVLRNHLPVRDPKLPPQVYEKVLLKMFAQVESMESDQGADSEWLYQQAKDHLLNTLCALGPTLTLRDHVKCYTRTSFPHPRLDEAEKSLLRRKYQTAVGFLEFPASPPINRSHPPAPSVSDIAENSDSLFSAGNLVAFLSSRVPMMVPSEETNQHESGVLNSHVALEALAELNWMRGRFEGALQCYLAIGCLHAVPALSVVEEDALVDVNTLSEKQTLKDTGSTQSEEYQRYSHVIPLIESHQLHNYLLNDDFLPSELVESEESSDGEPMSDPVTPLVALVRLVGLVPVANFLVEHCVHAVRDASHRYRSSGALSSDARDSLHHVDWNTTLPINAVAKQFSGHPKLLYWFLHLIFERKPEIYVLFPTTAVPPTEIRDLHRSHLDLYIRFGGDAKDSARFVASARGLVSDNPATPLLRFLKSVLPLGGIRADEVRRFLEAERIGSNDPALVDAASGDVKFPHRFALELAYIMEHHGKVNNEGEAKMILDLYLKGANSLSLAAFYAQRNTEFSSLLWGSLLEHCLNKDAEAGKVDGALFGSLLEAAALSGADLSHLVTEIPQGMPVEGLRPRLVAAVTDYRLKLQMHQAASKVFSQEKIDLLRELGHRSRRGTRYLTPVPPHQNPTSVSSLAEPPAMIQKVSRDSSKGSDAQESSLIASLRPLERQSRRRLSFSLPVR